MRMHWAAPIAACIAISSVDVVCAHGPDWGKNEFLTACQPCHGTTGKGDGRARGRSEPVGFERVAELIGRIFEMIDRPPAMS